jgi:hypothetical protein
MFKINFNLPLVTITKAKTRIRRALIVTNGRVLKQKKVSALLTDGQIKRTLLGYEVPANRMGRGTGQMETLNVTSKWLSAIRVVQLLLIHRTCMHNSGHGKRTHFTNGV